MFDLLAKIYARSEDECDIGIAFRPTHDGKQQNDCRDLVLRYLASPSLAHGQSIADHLGLNSDARSGLELLFLIGGKEGQQHKIVISRFPTDSAIYVEEGPRALTVEFLDRVFMKNKHSYKAAMYRDASLKGGFWSGKAIDKQTDPRAIQLTNYWIVDFLISDFAVSAAAGTHRLGVALREAVRKSPLEIKQEIAAAVTLAAGLAGQRTSINEFSNHFKLSDAAKLAIRNELKTANLADEKFVFDVSEFRSLITYKAVELSNGALLTAQAENFDQVFDQRIIDKVNKEVQFSTKGRVVNERLKTAP